MGQGEKNRDLSEQFARVLADLDQELLPEDRLIASAFLDIEHHVTAEDLLDLLRAQTDLLDVSHIRRTMRLLCELGIAQQVSLDGMSYYEHLHLDSHHDHLVCVRCGRIVEFVDEEIERRLAAVCGRTQFMPLMHKLEVRGVCSQCVGAMPATQALSSCLNGERVTVVDVLGGRGIRRRLSEMGLLRNTQIRVLSANGPVTIELRGSRIALGRNEAMRIIVSKLPDDKRESQ